MASFVGKSESESEGGSGSGSAGGDVFEFGGAREMVSAGRVAELLASVTHITDPTVLRLSNKSFSIEAAQAIAERLATFARLSVVDISDIIAGRHEDEALLVLQTLCTAMAGRDLLEVNVSDNAFGLKGVDVVKAILVSKVTEKFYFCNNGLSAEAVERLATILIPAEGDGAPPIKLLHFYNNMSGNGGAIAMSQIVRACVHLQDFRFSATRSMAEGCGHIAEAVDSLSTFHKLDLSDNNFGEASGAILARAVLHQPHLASLNLRDAGLSAASLSALFAALSSTPFPSQLRFLDFSGNDLTPESCEDFVKVLQNCDNLQELYLDDNDIESEGAATLAAALNDLRREKKGVAKSLQLLSVCTCSITAYGALKLARAVAKIDTFCTLFINGNEILEDNVPQLESILTEAGKALEDMEDNDGDGEDDAGSAAEEDEESEAAEEEGDADADDSVDLLADVLQKSSI
jgi:Ran GTPase-activating protein 1